MKTNVKERPSKQERKTPLNEDIYRNYTNCVHDSDFNPNTYPVTPKDKPKKNNK